MQLTARADRTIAATLDALVAQNLPGALVVDRGRHPLGYASLSSLQQAVRDGKGNGALERLPLQPVPLMAPGEGESVASLLLRVYRDHSPQTPVAVVDGAGRLLEVLSPAAVALRSREALEAQLKAAHDENHQFHLIMELLSDMITVSDARGEITWANGACDAIFGLAARELIGRSVFDLERGKVVSPRSITGLVLKTRQQQTMVQETTTGRRLMVLSWPVFAENGQIHRVICISRDITELGHLQQRLKETEAMAEHYRHKLLDIQPPESRGRGFVAHSRPMQRILELVRQVAGVNTSVLITGESGSGKEVVARQLHELSPRARGPYVRINCGAIPETLLESELFGYAPGAFTGAARGGKEGLIEQASGGTLFLDEVGELPLAVQVKLLRVIQERELQPVGGSRTVKVDFRLLTATNRNLEEMVAQGQFRPDLYYRINVIPIHIPPLRERREDIPLLVHHFLDRFGREYQRARQLAPEALDVLMQYAWPGNVRELENLMERLVVTVADEVLEVHHLPDTIRGGAAASGLGAGGRLPRLKEAVTAVEEQLLRQAYEQCGSVHGVARALGLDPATASRKLRKLRVRNV